MKRFITIALFLLVTSFFLGAAEFHEGSIRLVLVENTGRFLLYSLGDNSRYEPLFFDQDPRTSFISVMINDRAYKLGDSIFFKTRMVNDPSKPAFIFESNRLIVTQEFLFIKTIGSNIINGVEMKITIESKSAADINVGFRFLLDTHLGERGSSPHFYVDTRPLNTEFLVYGTNAENNWVSKNSRLSLMGSISAPERRGPDSVYFANWKRLADAAWKMPFDGGRNFNAPPYSIGDSAVCYYYEPRSFGQNDIFTASIFLATEDSMGFGTQPDTGFSLFASAPVITAPSQEPAAPVWVPEITPEINAEVMESPDIEDQVNRDMALIRDLIARIDGYIENNAITEEELAAMEQTLDRLLIRYGFRTGN